MKDMIDGPPTKPGDEQKTQAEQDAGELQYLRGLDRLRQEAGITAAMLRDGRAKSLIASLDAPVPEWLPAERLGEFQGCPVWIEFKSQALLPMCGRVHGIQKGAVWTDGRTYYPLHIIERFCPITLPPDPPAASQDVWEEVAKEVLNEALDVDSDENAALDNIVAVLKDRFEPLQQENERLKRGEFTPDELQNLCHNLSEDDYNKFCHGCDEYQKKLFGRCRTDELIKFAAEQHNDATAEPEKEAIAEADAFAHAELEKVRDRIKAQPSASPAPSLPTPRRFRCKTDSGRTLFGYEVADLLIVLLPGETKHCGLFRSREAFRELYHDLEFLPDPSQVFKVKHNSMPHLNPLDAFQFPSGVITVENYGTWIPRDFKKHFTRV